MYIKLWGFWVGGEINLSIPHKFACKGCSPGINNICPTWMASHGILFDFANLFGNNWHLGNIHP